MLLVTIILTSVITVTATVIDGNGALEPITFNRFVIDSPCAYTLDFCHSPTACVNTEVTFDNLTTGATENPVFTFDYGDGTSPGASPVHIYSSVGTYTVTLTAGATTSCPSQSLSSIIIVNNACNLASGKCVNTLDFCHPPTACVNTEVTFDNLTAGASENPVFAFDYGDGTSLGASPVHIYSSVGTYTVTLTAGATASCPSQSLSSIIIVNNACNLASGKCVNTLDFCHSPTACVNTEVTFNNLTTGATENPVFTFDYGDGTSPGASPVHIYSSVGTYTVTLTAGATASCPSQSLSSIIIVNNACNLASGKCVNTLDFCHPPIASINKEVTFDNLTASATENPVFTFDYGDGTSPGTSPVHTYSSIGTYTVTLTSGATASCPSQSLSNIIIINNAYNIASGKCVNTLDFCHPPTACINKEVTFDNLTASTTENPVFTFDYGDGTSPGTSPVHTYSSIGTYTVTLTSGATASCPSQSLSNIIILNNNCTAESATCVNTLDFCHSPVACTNKEYTFNNLSQAGTINPIYTWNYGDGSGASSSPVHTYTLAGTYTVILAVPSTAFCPGKSITSVINVVDNCLNPCAVPPVISISPSAPSICNGGSSTLMASGGISYSWSPAEGLSSTNGASVTANPTTTTTYTVIGTNAVGCANTATVTVIVNPIPVTTVSTSSSAICKGMSSVLTADGAETYNWSTGETTASITVIPSTTSTYTVVGTTQGCSSATATATVLVNALPIVNVNSSTICNGQNTTLTASGGDTYLWSTNEVTNSINVNPSASTSYTVTATLNGCAATATANVTVNVLPSIAVNSATICNGQSAVLTANGGETYSWSTGATTNSITVSPSANVSYTVTGTNINGCSASSVSNVIYTPLINIVVNNPTICNSTSAIITATGANTYLWSTGENGSSINVSPTTTTTYSVTGTLNGCQGTSTSTVIVSTLPLITVNNTTICSGELGTLTANGGTSYSWSTGETTASITVNPAFTTTFTVTGSNNGCSNQAFATVVVGSMPNLTINPSALTVCSGQNITIVASGADSYTWSTGETTSSITRNVTYSTYIHVVGTSNGCSRNLEAFVNVQQNPSISVNSPSICSGQSATLTTTGGSVYLWSTGETTSSITVNPINTATYSVTGSSSNGCSASLQSTVTVYAVPTVSISVSPSSTICSGTSITLTGKGANSYTWSGGITDGVAFVPATTTTYTLIGGNTNGCTNTAIQLITVNSLPVISVNSATVCSGQNTLLTASGATSYVWSNSETSNAITITPIATEAYTVTGTNNTGCTAVATSTVTVYTIPVITISPTNNKICTGGTVALMASGASSYTWTPSNGLNSTSGADVTAGPNLTTTYTATGTGECGLIGSQTVTVNVNVVPPINITVSAINNEICSGQFTNIAASGAPNFTWSPAIGISSSVGASITASPLKTTTYTVNATSECGIPNTSNVTIKVNEQPVITVSTTSSSICLGGRATLSALGALAYSWSPSTGLDKTTGATVAASPQVTTTYTVTGASVCGVVTTQTVQIAVNQIQGLTASPYSSVICRGDAVQITANGSPTYTWSPALGLNKATGNTVIANPLVSTSYTVMGTNNSGCPNYTIVDVIVDCPEEIIGCSFSNYGASVYVSEGTHLNVYCNLLNELGGVVDGTLRKGDFQNNNHVNVLLDWIHNAKNDLYIAPRIGVTSLFGTNQKMMGNSNTRFFQLDSDGKGTKSTYIDEYAEDNLNLKGNELALSDYTFHVEKNDVNTITGSPLNNPPNGGFISTDGTGYLSRQMDLGDSYIFPLGSKRNTMRFRPIEITNGNEADEVKVGFNNEPAVPYDVNKKAPNVKSLNSQFYHRISNSVPTATNKIIKSYFVTTDGSFQSIAHWGQNPTSPTPVYWWKSTPSPSVNNTPNLAGLVYALSNGIQSFDDIPYILAQSGFYVNVTQFGDPVPSGPNDPENPQNLSTNGGGGTIITVTATNSGTAQNGTGGLGNPMPTGPTSGNSNPNGGGPTVFTPSPVPGNYDIAVTPANNCGIPGKISFTISNDGTIDPASVKYSAANGGSALGVLSTDAYSIDNYNSGISLNSTPASLLTECVNSIKVSLGQTKDFVFDRTASETIIEVVIPSDISGVSLSSFNITKPDNSLVSNFNLVPGDNVVDWSTIAASLNPGVYKFNFTVMIGSNNEKVNGQFILK